MDNYLKLSANLASGESVISDLKNNEVEIILKIFKENKVPLLYINEMELGKLKKNKNFKDALLREQDLFNKRYKTYSDIHNSCMKKNIKVILFKSYGEFTYLGSDLDLMVRRNEQDEVEKIMQRLGYYLAPHTREHDEPYKRMYKTIDDEWNFEEVEFYDSIAWYVEFVDSECLFDTVELSNNYYRLSKENRLLMVLAHGIVENRKIFLSDLMLFRKSINNHVDVKYIENMALNRGWVELLYFGFFVFSNLEKQLWGDATFSKEQIKYFNRKMPILLRRYSKKILAKNVTAPIKMSDNLIRIYYLKKILFDKNSNYVNRFLNFLKVFRKVLTGHLFGLTRRYLVVFTGIDGAGKSTLIMKIKELCSLEGDIQEPIVVWSRIDSNIIGLRNFLYKIARPLFLKNEITGEILPEKKQLLLKKNPIVKIIWLYINIFELVIIYLTKIWLPLLFQKVVICDRYSYDVKVDIQFLIDENDLSKKLAFKILDFFAPKPDIVFFINTPPGIAFSRKEHESKIDLEILSEKSKMLENVIGELDEMNIERVDNYDTEFKETIREVSSIFLKEYYGKGIKNSDLWNS